MNEPDQMSDEDIKNKIRDYYQIELNNLANTDNLADILEQYPDESSFGDRTYDRANELLASGPRIVIEWPEERDSAGSPYPVGTTFDLSTDSRATITGTV